MIRQPAHIALRHSHIHSKLGVEVAELLSCICNVYFSHLVDSDVGADEANAFKSLRLVAGDQELDSTSQGDSNGKMRDMSPTEFLIDLVRELKYIISHDLLRTTKNATLTLAMAESFPVNPHNIVAAPCYLLG